MLKILKNFLLGLIAFIDLQIAKLRAFLAQWDLLAKVEKIIYDKLNELIEQMKDAMIALPDGPLNDLCPEFYSYFLDPAISLLDANTAALSAVRNKYKNKLSWIYILEQQIAYWEQIKADLVSAVDVLDDAIHQALLVEAAELVP